MSVHGLGQGLSLVNKQCQGIFFVICISLFLVVLNRYCLKARPEFWAGQAIPKRTLRICLLFVTRSGPRTRGVTAR